MMISRTFPALPAHPPRALAAGAQMPVASAQPASVPSDDPEGWPPPAGNEPDFRYDSDGNPWHYEPPDYSDGIFGGEYPGGWVEG